MFFGAVGLCRSGPLVAGAFYVLVAHYGGVAHAAEPNVQSEIFFALKNYAQLIDSGRQPVAGAVQISRTPAGQDSSDDAYAALKEFSARIGVDRAQSAVTGPKVAEAESLFDALKEWSQKGSSSKSSPAAPTPNGPVSGGTKPSEPVEAEVVGTKVCVTCHADQAVQFNHTLMGRLARTQKGKFECESCHGPGSEHVNAGGGRGVGGIISFRPEDRSRTAQENNAICLACHERGDRTYWNGSTHETRGLMCSNCHTVMKNVSRKFQLKTAFAPDTCYQCHKDRRAQNYFSSHMPVREGKITCSNCHNPHGSATEAMLRENSVNDNCYKCHAEKRGPFLWEHNPVRENCLNCHDPHGSTKMAMLKVQVPKLCQECHGFVNHGGGVLGPTNSQFIFNKGCANCHSKVHGSNHPSGTFFFR
jgi:DmsE family decaheme c-type cytochrome